MLEFTSADMRSLMFAYKRLCYTLALTDCEEDILQKTRISAFIIECGEEGERGVDELIDCARGKLQPN